MLKILIVDDDLEIVRSLGNAFTTMLRGYQVFTAITGNQGLNYIKQEKPEIIIMDVRLGPVSGMDLLEDYPKHAQDYHPHIIVITAYDDERAKKRAEELKVDAYLQKPFPQEILLIKVLESIKKYHDSGSRNVDFALRAFRRKLEDRDDTKTGLSGNPPEDP